jgi:phosphoribosyl 1,2-cyclic phosphodiesterase
LKIEKNLFFNFKILSFAVMSLFITSLNSGSNGNCYYVGNETEAVLVDAGISCREIEKRMKRLGLLMQKIKAVFISHEHSDHIYGLCGLVKKYRLPVYITEATMQNGRLALEQALVKVFVAHQPVFVGNLSVIAFPKFHDAADPYSFVVECDKVSIGIFTDIGKACKNVIHYFKQCHAAFLEANYDEEMLHKGNYPFYLKKRISGGMGHLSNNEALDIFIRHRPPFMSHLLLSHLSKNNNSPELVQKIFDAHAGNVQIIIASRYNETSIFRICADSLPHKIAAPAIIKKSRTTQLSFEFA